MVVSEAVQHESGPFIHILRAATGLPYGSGVWFSQSSFSAKIGAHLDRIIPWRNRNLTVVCRVLH
jgi:hypothetical protein